MKKIAFFVMVATLLFAGCEKDWWQIFDTGEGGSDEIAAVVLTNLGDDFWDAAIVEDSSNCVFLDVSDDIVKKAVGVVDGREVYMAMDDSGRPVKLVSDNATTTLSYGEGMAYVSLVCDSTVAIDSFAIGGEGKYGNDKLILNGLYDVYQMASGGGWQLFTEFVGLLRDIDGMNFMELIEYWEHRHDEEWFNRLLEAAKVEEKDVSSAPNFFVGIKTGGVTNITKNSATCEIDGYLRVLDAESVNIGYGVMCYLPEGGSTVYMQQQVTPFTTTLHISDMTISLPVAHQFVDLAGNTTYYYRAFFVDYTTGHCIYGDIKSFTTKNAPTGDGLFSVGEFGRQVRFAPGNLASGGRSFTAHQYDYGGYFGWGTGSNPTNTSTDERDYPSFDDWGNHIAGGWRTLTRDEWSYVIWSRADASAKRGAATVCGVHGMVLLPDNFSGGTFTAGFNGWSRNVYDASSWSDMEDAGAVFLPAAGFRDGTVLRNVGTSGKYWSSTPYDEVYAYGMAFGDYVVCNYDYYGYDNRFLGRSVRLVQDY